MWKSIAGSVIILIATACTAMAQCHVGAQAGLSIASAAISLPSVPATLDGLGARSRTPDLGLGGGCDVRITGSPFMVGVFGDYTWKDTQFSLSFPGNSFTASLGNSWTVGGRLGYVLSNNVMPYALVGYTTSDVTYSQTIAGAPTRLTGWTSGGGIEIPLAQNLSFAVETRYTRFAEADLVAGLATLKADQLSGMARLNFTFGGTTPVKTVPLK